MLKKIKIDKKFIKFIFVGVLNTLFGTTIMFVLYNCLNCNYYISSFCNYFFGSILSYFLNKYFTFNYQKKSVQTILKFILNISLCYFIAYFCARKLIELILTGYSRKLIDNIAMILGMGLFVVCNYFGQKLFVFKSNDASHNKIN